MNLGASYLRQVAAGGQVMGFPRQESIAGGTPLPIMTQDASGVGRMDDKWIEERILRSEADVRAERTRLDGKLDLVLTRIELLRDELDGVHSELTATKRDVNSNKWQLFALGLGLVTLLIGVWAFTNQMTGITLDAIGRTAG